MASSMIPPPIVQSTYTSPPPAPPIARSVLFDQPPPLHDRQSELEADLQYLLDAQAEGLLKGLEGEAHDDTTSTGSVTPTARSIRSSSARETTRRVKKKPGLRSARKGLYSTMRALSAVKDDELDSISSSVRESDERLKQIETWERKRAGLREAAQNVESDEDTVRVQRLRGQAETVEAEIRELERQLEDRRVLHKRLLRQVADVENAVQAKMASYTDSLKLLEEDVRKFLAVAPGQDDCATGNIMDGDGRQSVWRLPPQRRTLELAKEQYTHDREAIVTQRGEVEREKEALEEGAAVWKDVVTSVTDFERRMRDDMRAQAEEGQSQAEATARLKGVLGHMDSLIEDLDSKFEVAMERNWNLLIAAIGAEVDALRRGKEILRGVLGVEEQDGEEQKDDLLDTQDTSDTGRGGSPASSGVEEIHGLDKSFETARPLRRRRGSEDGRVDNESEDDHPDPELLFSQHEVDS